MRMNTLKTTLHRATRLGLCAGLALVFVGAPVFAGTDSDKEKKEKEWKELEKQQKGKLRKKENPLKKILDLLKDVEDRLVDADTGDWTQEEQRQVVEALKRQDQATKALDDLIEQIQKMQNQSQSQSQSQNQQQKKDQQKQGGKGRQQKRNETPEQRRERERRERERQKRQKAEQQKKQLEKQKQQGKKNKKEKKPKGAHDKKEPQKKDGAKMPEDDQNPLSPRNGKVSPWGNLPLKLHLDAEKARNDPVPEDVKELINGYRKRINED